MVRIRLTRLGTNRKPFYRIVAAPREKPRDGRFLEVIGTYHPKAKENPVQLKKDRFDYWISKGAKPTITVTHLVKRLTGVAKEKQGVEK